MYLMSSSVIEKLTVSETSSMPSWYEHSLRLHLASMILAIARSCSLLGRGSMMGRIVSHKCSSRKQVVRKKTLSVLPGWTPTTRIDNVVLLEVTGK